MRTIKFRGMFAKDSRLNWAYGDLIAHERNCWIISKYSNLHSIDQYSTFVQPHTVGQFTGLYDKNGKEIYEGDILRYCEKNKQIYIVKYGSYNRNADLKSTAPQYIGATFFLDGTGIGMYKKEDYEVINPIYTYNGHAFLYPVSGDFPSTFERYKELWGLEIIGNIHDNPELLE